MPHLKAQAGATPKPAPEAMAGAGLRVFFNMAKAWRLTESEQLGLLGLTSRSTLFVWKNKAAGGPVKLGPDALERLSNLVGIWKALAILFAQNDLADQWIHRPNDNFPFLGDSPLVLMRFSQEGLAQVRRHLDARRGGWG
jgi:uncharacterized protein (DUF2384 family)